MHMYGHCNLVVECGVHIFPCIVAKIRPELKLINIDFVIGGQRNLKCNSDFREVQISVSVSILSGLERLCTQFFTIFHKTLRMARKCGRPDACCLWDKLEVDVQF